MNRVYSLLVIALALLGLDMIAVRCAYAAKIPVWSTTPLVNDDGSALTDLQAIRFEWGTCNGTFFGVPQASITIPVSTLGTRVDANVYPTGLTQVCIRAYAINAGGHSSAPSNSVAVTLSTLGKPITLGQPISLPPKP